MKSERTRLECATPRVWTRLALVVAIIAMIAVVGNRPGEATQERGQLGVPRHTCNADNIYIYQYGSTNSARRGVMRRGAPFQVYYFVNGTWAFGVHNVGGGVSGYVLREKLCS